MDITDDMFLHQPDDPRLAGQSSQDAGPCAASHSSGSQPQNSGLQMKAIPIPAGLFLTAKFGSNSVSELSLPRGPFGVLLFSILETAAWLAFGTKEEWTAAQEKEAEEARKVYGPGTRNPKEWSPPKSVRELIDPMNSFKLPATMAAAVKLVFAETFAGFSGLSEKRRHQVNNYMPANGTSLSTEVAHRVRNAGPGIEGDRFWATFVLPDQVIDSGYLLCSLDALGDLVQRFAALVVYLGLESTADAQADYYLAKLATGLFPIRTLENGHASVKFEPAGPFASGPFTDTLNELHDLLVGLVVVAAGKNPLTPEHRRRFLSGQSAFNEPLNTFRRYYL